MDRDRIRALADVILALLAERDALVEALERADHTLTAHGHIDADTPLHATIRAALSRQHGETDNG